MNNNTDQNTNEAQYPTACGGRLREPADYPSAIYHGTRVYFCKQACLRAFESAPDAFMAGEIEHPNGADEE